MKKWNEPELKELNINQTENGIFDSYFESFVLVNDNKKSCTPPEEQTS